MRWPALRLVAPVAGAAVLVAAVAGGLLLFNLPNGSIGAKHSANPSSTPSASSSPALSSSPSPSPQPSTAIATTFRDWTRVDLPDPAPGVYGGGTPTGLAVFKGEFIAVGGVWAACCAEGDPSLNRGVIWTSNDGRTWQLHGAIPAFRHVSLTNIITDGERLLAVGTYAAPVAGGVGVSVPAVWVSTDGTKWTRVVGPAPSYVATTPNGFIGAVTEGWAPGPDASVRFVSSADGLTWIEASPRFNVALRGLAVDANGRAIAVGSVPGTPLSDGTPTTDMVVWHSEDGVSWSGPETILHDGLPVAVAADSHGFLIVGWSTKLHSNGQVVDVTGVWRLAGSAFTALPVTLAAEEDLTAIFVIGDAIVASGDTSVSGTANAMVWISTDGGASWGRVPDHDAFTDINNELTGAAKTTDGLLAIGRRWDSTTGHPLPVVWLSSRCGHLSS